MDFSSPLKSEIDQDIDPFHDQMIEPLDNLPPFDDSIEDIFNLDLT